MRDRLDSRDVYGRNIHDNRILILFDPVDNRDLELSVPVSRYPEFYTADHLNSKHPGIAAIAVVDFSFDSCVFPSA
jgi:hypothetical protein